MTRVLIIRCRQTLADRCNSDLRSIPAWDCLIKGFETHTCADRKLNRKSLVLAFQMHGTIRNHRMSPLSFSDRTAPVQPCKDDALAAVLDSYDLIQRKRTIDRM